MDYSQFYLPKPDPVFNSLPTETLYAIIECLTLEHEVEKVNRNLLSLSRASRRLREITTPFIFTHNVKNKGGSGLGRAARLQDRKAMEKLIHLGASISSDTAGYPLFMAIKRRDADTLKFLLEISTTDEVKKALWQGVNSTQDTVLHKAIFHADVSCVKVLMEAGADPTIRNTKYQRAVEFILKDPREDLVGGYTEIVNLLLAKNPSWLITLPSWGIPVGVKHKTRLAKAAERGFTEIMKIIIDTNVEAGNDLEVNAAVLCEDKVGRTPLTLICDASKWPSDQKGCDKYLAVVKLLLRHGSNPYTALSWSCDSPISLADEDQPKWHTIRLQRDVVRVLIEQRDIIVRRYGRPRHEQLSYFNALEKFLRTVVFYLRNTLKTTELARPVGLGNFDMSTSRAGLLSEVERLTAPCSEWKYESSQIFEALREVFQLLVKNVGDRVNTVCGTAHWTLLHRAVTIPGIFGLFATASLLDHEANVYKKDILGRNPLDLAIEENRNQAAVYWIQRWKQMDI
jgi:ankyrin repeat protein